jgi:hypothetical protein
MLSPTALANREPYVLKGSTMRSILGLVVTVVVIVVVLRLMGVV